MWLYGDPEKNMCAHQQLCLKPSLYGRFSLDHLWPLLGDHRGQNPLNGLSTLRAGDLGWRASINPET